MKIKSQIYFLVIIVTLSILVQQGQCMDIERKFNDFKQYVELHPRVMEWFNDVLFYLNYLVFLTYCNAIANNAYSSYGVGEMQGLCMGAAQQEASDAMNDPML
eukprot:403336049